MNHDGAPWLRPHWLQLIGLFVPIAIVVGATFAVWLARPSAASDFVMAVVGVTGLYLAVRWELVAGVRRSGHQIVVAGVLWSRRIRLDRIDKISKGYVAVHWHTRRGRPMVTPITALWSKPRPLPIVTGHSNHAVDVIRGWVLAERESGIAEGQPRH